MSVAIRCDVCGNVIPDDMPMSVFRTWSLSTPRKALHVGHIEYNFDYHICNRCVMQLLEFAEQMGKAES